MYLPASTHSACIAALSSLTLAIKAQRALSASGLGSEVISLSSGQTRRGCAYGLEFPCSHESEVHALLRAARIPVSQYLKKGESPP